MKFISSFKTNIYSINMIAWACFHIHEWITYRREKSCSRRTCWTGCFSRFLKVLYYTLLSLSLQFIFHCCSIYPPLLGFLIIVFFCFLFLSYLVGFYVSFPTDPLRYFPSVWINLITVPSPIGSSTSFLFESLLSELGSLLLVILSELVKF